jgi:hypothetical protein
MNIDVWLVVNRRGTVKAKTRGRPTVGPNEVLVKARLSLPDDAFRSAQFIANIDNPRVEPRDVAVNIPTQTINTDGEQI